MAQYAWKDRTGLIYNSEPWLRYSLEGNSDSVECIMPFDMLHGDTRQALVSDVPWRVSGR
jgi:hypothetical protein